MKIIEVVIDGFKSYAVRTVISGWDQSFNSITGLNGSGKSNILDSICFVLGITNMTTVRAQNLQDLIYKRGQAGVTKASVTIVFDNSDKERSPIGFEAYAQISVTRQIVLGGTSKYLINGHRAQQQTVQNLFQSVQLNVNNPNFLIMQGRITKVLNMKSMETLSMIEEAAGTRMFEDRRDKAFKTMAKKDTKLQEIGALLHDEIDPKLERLRTEKRAFLHFQQTRNDVERLTRLVAAYDYQRNKAKLDESTKDLENIQQRNKELIASIEEANRQIGFLREDIEKVNYDKDKELRKGGMVQSLEEEAKKLSHEMTRLDTLLGLKQSGLEEELNKREGHLKTTQDLQSQVEKKRTFYEQVQRHYSASQAELAKHTEEAERMEELIQMLQTGVASKEGQQSGYQGQLQDARDRASSANTKLEKARRRCSYFGKQIVDAEPRAREAKQQNLGLTRALEVLRKQARNLEYELGILGVELGNDEDMYRDESIRQQRIREATERSDELQRRVANINFSYSDPTSNFDRSKVKGLVAQLFSLGTDHTRVSTALEICAGGRLYNVVVDTSETGTQLLQNGRLKKRITIIPLDRIAAFRVSTEKIGAAQSIAPGQVDLALSLIGYDVEVTAAMEYVFGSTLVCEDAETAKCVTFDPLVRMKSVTLEGDVYDPSGTLSGGCMPRSSGVLKTVQALNEISKELKAQQQALSELHSTMESEKGKHRSARRIKQELELKTHEIELAAEKIRNNSAASTIQMLETMESTVMQLKQDMIDAKAQHDQAVQDATRIERELCEFSENRDDKLANLQESLDGLKLKLTQYNAKIKPLQRDERNALLESEQCVADSKAALEKLSETDKGVDVQRKEIDILIQERFSVKQKHDIAIKRLRMEQAKVKGFDDELRQLKDAVSKKSEVVMKERLNLKLLGHQIEKCDKERQAAIKTISALEQEHNWIIDEQVHFDRQDSLYDFSNQDMSECRTTLNNLTERFQSMKRKINPKVMNMIDSVEKKEASLKNMMRTVMRDKRKIQDTIHSLDAYKRDALQKTWTKVNTDFGNIFAELLPGSFARLDPPDGKTIADGLEVKVSLGKVWKQSLTELSGGQRSLVALSLILALLQFKPAPMYILDEVDAALDLSHTQNIGRLIKTRFRDSQFIVVSLKDGMFQNANRIFRARFSDGTSIVQALTASDLK